MKNTKSYDMIMSKYKTNKLQNISHLEGAKPKVHFLEQSFHGLLCWLKTYDTQIEFMIGVLKGKRNGLFGNMRAISISKGHFESILKNAFHERLFPFETLKIALNSQKAIL